MRNVIAFVMAAAVASLGSVVLLRAGQALARLAGDAPRAGRPGFFLLVTAFLLVAAGVVPVAMAGKELLHLRRPPRVR